MDGQRYNKGNKVFLFQDGVRVKIKFTVQVLKQEAKENVRYSTGMKPKHNDTSVCLHFSNKDFHGFYNSMGQVTPCSYK